MKKKYYETLNVDIYNEFQALFKNIENNEDNILIFSYSNWQLKR